MITSMVQIYHGRADDSPRLYPHCAAGETQHGPAPSGRGPIQLGV